jgi:hypothetical protein
MTRWIAGLLAAMLCVFGIAKAEAQSVPLEPLTIPCTGGNVPSQSIMVPTPAPQPNLLVKGKCTVVPGKKYFYGNVNIVNGGELLFEENGATPINFWTSSIIIENGGAMVAGTPQQPFGTNGGQLTIYIYGAASPSAIDANGNPVPVAQQGQGTLCRSPIVGGTNAPCGIPQRVWNNNGVAQMAGCVGSSSTGFCLPGLPVAVKDFFYQYGPLYGDAKPVASGRDKGKVGYFGYKVLAVSFGGTLTLYGYKGASYDAATDDDHTDSGVSWVRLAGSIKAGATSLTLDTAPGKRWHAGDEVVVTTTDYLPGHSERLLIDPGYGGAAKVPVRNPNRSMIGTQWAHNGTRFALSTRIAAANGRMTLDPQLVQNGAETRAAVALLSRSIRIVSAGDMASETFGDMPNTYSFGAHMIVRQGFAEVQIQGVEFKQMGQGGRLGHYPVHFHMTRKTPPNTFVKDSSVNESMTRWYVLHSTSGVTLARNVGWKSIGHGYYLEDGTETDNNFYSNIGIFARGAIKNGQNPRNVPGILADNQGPFPPPNVSNQAFPYRSDIEHPTVFWITNGWNDFIGNMAAGAGTCGACYWFVPSENSDMPDVPTGSPHMSWSGYAALQKNSAFAGATPLKSFYKNYCTTAMHSFQTTPDAPGCNGVIAADAPIPPPPNLVVQAVQSISPKPLRHTVIPPQPNPPFTAPDNGKDPYYPHVLAGLRHATRCPPAATQIPNQPTRYDCTEQQTPPAQNIEPCGIDANGNPLHDCAVTVLDHYTSAFNWANGNVSAVWLRPQWYLLDNSVLSDVQNGALTFITGGDYTHSSIIPGYWAVARNTVFIGETQKNNPLASNAGPFNKGIPGSLACDNGPSPGGYCLNAKEGVSFPLVNFFVNQRMFNIYDGPAYQDSNIYLDITTTPCQGDNCIYGANTQGVRKGPPSNPCYLPNAAIAWKQPNGFFYPPAFHSVNLFFDNVDIRHYVIDPLFKAPDGVTPDQNFGQGGTYQSDLKGNTVNGVETLQGIEDAYCGPQGATGVGNISVFFNGFTGIDRQTELNDDDGSLTGLSNSLLASIRPNPPNPLKQTISVNDDDFFTAPVETPECESNLGVSPPTAVPPANTCSAPAVSAPAVTAKTSPYDYVATVVWHPKSDGVWDSDCSNETCYGVPLYRQLLTGTEGSDEKSSTKEWAHWFHNGCNTNPETPQCRWPFIRMAGADIAQRNTLTVNNGTYYLETTVPLATQKSEDLNRSGPKSESSLTNFFNVFENGQTYYVFFLYAKETTRQTYQIYVGNNFVDQNDLQAIHMKIPNKNLVPVPITTRPAWLQTKPFGTDGKGVLTVTVDFNGLTELDPTPANGICQPQTFCSANSKAEGGCGCALKSDDPLVKADPGLMKECTKVCGTWAVKDLDCPKVGCLGFAFTLHGFVADGVLTHRPTPQPFPTTNDPNHLPSWATKFLRTATQPDHATGGSCFYGTLPGTNCTVP